MSELTMDSYFDLPFNWNPAASDTELKQVAQQLQIEWLPELRALYAIHDGASGLADDWEDQWSEQLEADKDSYPFAPRLLPLAEVLEFDDYRQGFYPDLRFFWTDDQSNYVGVYVEGPLRGMVSLLSHDEPSAVPCFRSVADFLHLATSQPERDVFEADDFKTLQETYGLFPKSAPDSARDAEDWTKAQACFEQFQQYPDSPLSINAHLENAICLTPYPQSDALLPYLDDENFYVSALAVRILGRRRYAPARAKIEMLAERPVANVQAEAQRALRNW